jgi:SAM-dependent methyltransferase
MAALPVLLHLNERSTGNPARDWLTAWAPRFMPGHDLRVLVLGCGEGWLERALVRHDWIAHIDACDFAADAVGRARALAPPRIDYHVLDLNRDEIEGHYDVVIAHSVLHHIENLEHAFDQIDRALKADGTLIVNEYAGPNRFQYGDDVLAIMNALLGVLPPHLRRSMMTARTYEAKERPTVEEMIRNDPSEAVRAEELLPMLAARYDILDRRDLGGTVMQHLLYDIIGNFRFDDPLARSLLEMMLTFEGGLVDEGLIPSDFVLCAARKKGAPPLRERKVELPPLPPEAFETMRDPLLKARRVVPERSMRASATPPATRKMAQWQLHLLRLALLAETPRRTPLNPCSRAAEAKEQLQFATGHETAFKWILSRAANVHTRAMLEAMRRVYIPPA